MRILDEYTIVGPAPDEAKRIAEPSATPGANSDPAARERQISVIILVVVLVVALQKEVTDSGGNRGRIHSGS